MNREELEQTDKIASREACKALSKMVSQPVSCEPKEFGTRTFSRMQKVIEPHALVASLDSFVIGQMTGDAHLVIPRETAFFLGEVLSKKSDGGAPPAVDLPKEAQEALEEFGNIVIGNYLKTFALSRGLTNVLHRAPRFSWNTWSALRDEFLLAVRQNSHVGVETEFMFQSASALRRKVYLILLFSKEIFGRV